MATNERRSKEAPLKGPAVSDLVKAIAKRNPTIPLAQIELAARAEAALSDVIMHLTPAEQAAILDDPRRLLFALKRAASKPNSRTDAGVQMLLEAAKRGHLEPSKKEESAGSGLGQRIDIEEGRRRIDAYARALPIEAWAGRVLGAGDLERQFAIPRSTLNAWHHRGAVIGLLKGERKHVYPVEQFIDGRPVKGMARLTKVIADGRAAWLWLRQPHGLFDDRTPLDELKAGRIAEVIDAAERDFG